MFIDLLTAAVMLFAFIKGFQKGLWLSLFHVAGLFIGMAAAIKLSAVCAKYLKEHTTIGNVWLPFLSFILIFTLVILLMYIAGKAMTQTAEAVHMGWLNKICGAILYVLLYGLICSMVLYYLTEMKLLNNITVQESKSGPILLPLAPDVMNTAGKIIPMMKDMFEQLEDFFSGVAQKVS